MDVRLSQDGDTSLIAVAGELDLYTASELADAAAASLSDASCRRLELDLSGLRFIDSSGINALIEIRDASRQAHTILQLTQLSPRVAEVLRLTAVDHLFDITEA